MGNDTANASTNRQQVGNEILANKDNPPTLWIACDYVLQFKFRIMHVAGSQNTAADFRSRLELTPKAHLKCYSILLLRESSVKNETNLFEEF